MSYLLKLDRVKHIRSAPYHPASNRQVERFIQTLKRALKASAPSGQSFSRRLSQFLFEYRASPHATTNRSPSQLFLGRPLRTRFDLLRPNVNSDVLSKQATQKLNFDRCSKPRLFSVGQSVIIRVHRSNTKWSRGIIINQFGPVTYGVDVQGHVVKCHVVKCHVDQLRGCPESLKWP